MCDIRDKPSEGDVACTERETGGNTVMYIERVDHESPVPSGLIATSPGMAHGHYEQRWERRWRHECGPGYLHFSIHASTTRVCL